MPGKPDAVAVAPETVVATEVLLLASSVDPSSPVEVTVDELLTPNPAAKFGLKQLPAPLSFGMLAR
jgi:hypothetical protein